MRSPLRARPHRNTTVKHLSTRTCLAGLLLAGLAIGAPSCNKLKLYNADRGEVIASVGNRKLYASDIAGLIEPGLTARDSVAALQAIAENWVRKEIKSAAAEEAFSEQTQDIEARVAEYRGALLTYRYEQEWVGQRLDTAVTAEQITEYYDANRNGFRLAGPIVKARIARIPAVLSKTKKL